MDKLTPTAELMKELSQRPGEAFVYLDGTWLAMLAGTEVEDIILITAGEGENFNEMTDEEINDYIVKILKKGVTRL